MTHALKSIFIAVILSFLTGCGYTILRDLDEEAWDSIAERGSALSLAASGRESTEQGLPAFLNG